MTFKIFLSIFSILIFNHIAKSQAPDFAWVRQLSGLESQTPSSIGLDSSGNIYTSGFFEGTVDFDPGVGTYTLSAPGTGKRAGYISKLDPAGNFIWAKKISGDTQLGLIGHLNIASMAVSETGEVNLTGFFEGLADFDPGPGVTPRFAGVSGSDVFVLKLDANGNLLWMVQIGAEGSEGGSGIDIDASNNIYVTGFFTDTVDFNPSSVAEFTMTTALSVIESYVLKLDATGNFVWAKKLISSVGSMGNAISLDALGNVISGGSYIGTTDFDPSLATFNITAAGNQDAYIWKLDAAGNFVWAKSIGGTSADGTVELAIDGNNNICVSGFFTGTADLDPGAAVLNYTSVGNNDVLLIKLNALGNLIWAKSIGSAGNDVASGITFGSDNALYATGQFEGSANFNQGGTSLTFSANVSDAFVAKLNSSGNTVWVKQMLGNSIGGGSAIVVDKSTSIYSTGIFSNTVDFDPNAATFNLSAMGNTDCYIHKMICGAIPQVTVSGNTQPICAGENSTLTVVGANTYSWNNVAGSASHVISPTATITYTLFALDKNGCADTALYTQLVEVCAGFSEKRATAARLKLIPNPAHDFLEVQINSDFENALTLKITDMQGRLLIEKVLSEPLYTIDLTQYKSGLYLITLMDGVKPIHIQKLIVVK